MDQANNAPKRLYRSTDDRIIWGVCGGLGEYYNLDPILFRVLFVALSLGGGAGVLIYIIMALVMPNKPGASDTKKEDDFDAKERVEGLVDELRGLNRNSSVKNWIGVFIIFLGAMLFLHQFFPWKIFSFDYLWPLIIIFVGVFMLIGSQKNCKKKVKDEPAEKTEAKEKTETVSEVVENKKTKKARVQKEKDNGSSGFMFRLFFGLIFIIAGGLFLLQNFNLIPGLQFNLVPLFQFWPVLIILAGLSLLSRGSVLGRFTSALITFLIVVAIFVFLFWPGTTSEVQSYEFDLSRSAEAKNAEVTIDAGAAVLSIDSFSGDSIAKGNLYSNITTLTTASRLENETQKIFVEMKGDVRRLGPHFNNDLTVHLSNALPLDLNIDSGASTVELDARDLLLENFTLGTGASKVDLTFGDRINNTNVLIDAGVSTLTINVPLNSGVTVLAQGGLSQKNFGDLIKTGEQSYESPNYDSAVDKINITIDAGVSSISIIRR